MGLPSRRRYPSLIAFVVLLILANSASAQYGYVSIDSITNARSASAINAGKTHQVSIRYDLTELSPNANWVGSNGYQVYSPNGADWGYLRLLSGPLVTKLIHPATTVFIRHYDSPDRVTWYMSANDGADPAGGYTGPGSGAGAYLATINTLGMEGWTGGEDNDIAVLLEFESFFADADQGRHICIDRNDNITVWEWAAGAFPEFPIWDNGLGESEPRCFEVIDCCQGTVGNVNLSEDEKPTIGDIVEIVGHLYIHGRPLPCYREADINRSGGAHPTADDISLGDISELVDYLFITGPQDGHLPDCP